MKKLLFSLFLLSALNVSAQEIGIDLHPCGEKFRSTMKAYYIDTANIDLNKENFVEVFNLRKNSFDQDLAHIDACFSKYPDQNNIRGEYLKKLAGEVGRILSKQQQKLKVWQENNPLPKGVSFKVLQQAALSGQKLDNVSQAWIIKYTVFHRKILLDQGIKF